ncbi:NAD(P)H-dependent flavin oxidoreductase YrpB (nitropropane dioxygenase family) [Paraburkholderia atlantica]|uniref:NAD(P)H-dependent flavin oxidoreductase n=1 Tax=Paraburkholderia atlantica TaxID=2654982 RepID=UPI00128C1A12|nr:nitronate monooxygenase [Paraburkholderia atlantica]MPW10539.1 nitronate monooxygenase [Paraburkholderia atlantica]
MSQPAFSNAVTELFGTRLPIVAGGLMWLADADYVAAASRAGIIGFITAASFPEPQGLRAEIRRCRELCEGGPFGVNVSMLPKLVPGEKTREVFELIIDEGVKFVETSGRNPEEFMPLLKGAGVKVLHKVPSVRFAVKAASVGVDAVAIVGAECGGHPGLDMVGSFVNAAWAESHLSIPYLIGGGIGRGSQLAAALAMGAAGVVVGTRFVVAEEIWAHDDYKRRLVEAGPTDTDLCMTSVRNTVRTLRNETTLAVKEIEARNANVTIQDLMPMVSGKIGRDAYVTGDWKKGLLSAGQSLAFVDRIEPLADIVQRFERDMRQAMGRVAIN